MGSSRKLGATFPSCVRYFFSAGFSAEKQAYFLLLREADREKITVRTALFKAVGERVWNCRQVLAAKKYDRNLPASCCRQKKVAENHQNIPYVRYFKGNST